MGSLICTNNQKITKTVLITDQKLIQEIFDGTVWKGHIDKGDDMRYVFKTRGLISNDKLFITSNLDGKNIYLSNNSNFEADAEYTFGFLAFTLAQNYYLEKNYKEAEENYLIAIETGNIEGPALNLGKLFLELKDYPNAKKYYKMAADLGNEEAQRIYREILQNGY